MPTVDYFPSHGHQSDMAILSEESVLLWTLLQPTLDSPWRQMYVWNEQLDQLVQAIDNCDPQSTFQQFTKFFQGACTSKALWSSSRDFGPLPKPQFINSESNDWRLPSTCAYPLLCILPDVCNMKTQSSPQMYCCHLDARVPQIQQPPGKSFNPSIAILFLLDLDMGTSPFQAKFTISQSASLENQQYLHPLRKTLVKSQNWCKCWIAAIIQRHWETAWDLDTHQNIKDGATGAWLAHLTALCQCVGSGCTPGLQYPFYQISILWIGHLTGYPSKKISYIALEQPNWYLGTLPLSIMFADCQVIPWLSMHCTT